METPYSYRHTGDTRVSGPRVFPFGLRYFPWTWKRVMHGRLSSPSLRSSKVHIHPLSNLDANYSVVPLRHPISLFREPTEFRLEISKFRPGLETMDLLFDSPNPCRHRCRTDGTTLFWLLRIPRARCQRLCRTMD